MQRNTGQHRLTVSATVDRYIRVRTWYYNYFNPNSVGIRRKPPRNVMERCPGVHS